MAPIWGPLSNCGGTLSRKPHSVCRAVFKGSLNPTFFVLASVQSAPLPRPLKGRDKQCLGPIKEGGRKLGCEPPHSHGTFWGG